MTNSQPSFAEGLANQLPVRDDDCESDLISLADLVITGIETPWHHFGVRNYDPDADGRTRPWAKLLPLKGSGLKKPVVLTEDTVRAAVVKYLEDRINRGMPLGEVTKMVDGSYTDAMVADSILQFALYGEEVLS